MVREGEKCDLLTGPPLVSVAEDVMVIWELLGNTELLLETSLVISV